MRRHQVQEVSVVSDGGLEYCADMLPSLLLAGSDIASV